MANWYDIPEFWEGIDDNLEFQQKLELDGSEIRRDSRKKKNKARQKDNSWAKKHNHKGKMRRRFLPMNPAMDMKQLPGMKCSQAIYTNFMPFYEGKFHDARMEYCINPYERIFLSQRGDLRVYHGIISCHRSNCFSLANKDTYVARLTNRRLRRERISDDEASAHSSYYRKRYSPLVDLW